MLRGILALLGDLPIGIVAALALTVGVVGAGSLSGTGFYLWNRFWDNPHVYSAGVAAGKAEQLEADRMAVAAQEAELRRIKAETERKLADATAIFRKQHQEDLDEIARMDAELADAPGADDPVWDAGVMQHYRRIWQGQH